MPGVRWRARPGARLLASAAAGVLGASIAAAADEVDDLGGFGADEDFADIEVDADTDAFDEGWWDIDGSVGVSSSIAYLSHEAPNIPKFTDWTGVTRLRARLTLELDVELPREFDLRATPYIWYDFSYLINGRSNFTGDVLDLYEWEWDFQDSYIEGPITEDLDVKIGRQVVNWGRSESLRVLDVLNPLDNREPARADIEDLRWSIGMAKLDYQLGRHFVLSAIAIPEIRFDDLPAFGSDFNPLPVPAPREIEPSSWSNWEFAASVEGIFRGWDASLHYAWFFNDLPRPKLRSGGIELVHERLHMVGAGASHARGSWLFKAEAAAFDGLGYLTDGLPPVSDPGKRHWRVDVLGGVEYFGIAETTIALDVVNRHILDYDERFVMFDQVRENSVEYAIRYTADWMNARLRTTILALLFGWNVEDGAVIRLQGDYTIRDGLILTAGMVLYQHGNLIPLNSWGRNDRVFIDIKWSF